MRPLAGSGTGLAVSWISTFATPVSTMQTKAIARRMDESRFFMRIVLPCRHLDPVKNQDDQMVRNETEITGVRRLPSNRGKSGWTALVRCDRAAPAEFAAGAALSDIRP
jgi:hypothetical protein